MNRNKKLQMDYIELVQDAKDLDNRVQIRLKNNDIQHIQLFIDGIEGTPYDGGTFEFLLEIEDNYPIIPPVVRSINKIWHPNIGINDDQIYPWGSNVCLHFVNHDRVNQDDGWNPESYTLATVMLQLILLLDSVTSDEENASNITNWEDPLNGEAADQYISNITQFVMQAQDYTQRYAM